jgi:hypothetical protein
MPRHARAKAAHASNRPVPFSRLRAALALRSAPRSPDPGRRSCRTATRPIGSPRRRWPAIPIDFGSHAMRPQAPRLPAPTGLCAHAPDSGQRMAGRQRRELFRAPAAESTSADFEIAIGSCGEPHASAAKCDASSGESSMSSFGLIDCPKRRVNSSQTTARFVVSSVPSIALVWHSASAASNVAVHSAT